MRLRLFLFCLFFHFAANAQTIQGAVLETNTQNPLAGVTITNIYTKENIASDNSGSFLIKAGKGELLEFKKDGYKTVRARIPDGYVPSYFKIIMQQGQPEMSPYVAAHSDRYDYTNDSLRFHDLYKHELDFPRLSSIDMIQHPFSALSKKNREIWNFQELYEKEEQQKYIDKTFNPEVITKITGLTGDSLNYYMRRNRPTYEQLRRMKDYEFYTFIRKTVALYRQRSRANNPRTSH